MYESILIPTDGSSAVEGGVTIGIDLARTWDAAVHCISVMEPTPDLTSAAEDERSEVLTASEERRREAITEVQERATDMGLEFQGELLMGVPYREILDYTRDHNLECIVMGTRGQAGADRQRLGTTTRRVVSLAERPVLVVPPSAVIEFPETPYDMYDEIVIATDGSDVAGRASEHGIEIAERYGADLHVVYVVDTTTYDLKDSPRSIVGLLKEGGQKAIETIATVARDRNLPVTTSVLRGIPEEVIREYATGVDADLVVMGTRGRTPGPEKLLGSTTARFLRRSDTPVLTVS